MFVLYYWSSTTITIYPSLYLLIYPITIFLSFECTYLPTYEPTYLSFLFYLFFLKHPSYLGTLSLLDPLTK